MNKKDLITIRKRFPQMSKILAVSGIIIGMFTLKNNPLLFAAICAFTITFSLLADMNFSMRLNGNTIELGYSLFWIFKPTHCLAVADVNTLCIQQASKKFYQIGLLTKENHFIELQRKPTLDVAEKIKLEIEEKIKNNWT